VCGKQLVFLALERAGGIAVWDVSNPAQSFCTDYINTRVDGPNMGDARDQVCVRERMSAYQCLHACYYYIPI
jgi:hypothetical protein